MMSHTLSDQDSYATGSSFTSFVNNVSTMAPTTLPPSSSNTLDLSTNVTIPTNSTTNHTQGMDPSSRIAAIAVFVSVMSIAIVGMSLFLYLRKRKSYTPLTCAQLCFEVRKRKRNSSTISHNPLTTDDSDLVVPRDRELFSIGDQDGGEDGRIRSRTRADADDDYFYDEIFERSAFVDEQTNKTNKQLTVEDFDDEFDIPDLIFKPAARFKTN